MIAADTSTWIAYLQGETGTDVARLDEGLRDKQVMMVPAVLSELPSDPKLPLEAARTICDVPRMEIIEGYWERAGWLRAKCWVKDVGRGWGMR